eukprot:9180451-Karenia_brevis.AAC.1
MSHGAARRSTGAASAAWVILATAGDRFSFIAGGASFLPRHIGSMDAEAQALDYAISAFRRY